VTDSTDWRVPISLSGQANVEQARQSFSEQEVEEDVRSRLGHNIVVGAGDTQIFLYAGTELAASEAERTAREVLGQLGIEAEFAVHRWHPIEEEWQSPDVAMPQTEAERQAEHQVLEDAETADSVAAGSALWQARAELPSHREAVELAHKLQGEGYTVVRRWKFLIVGANNDDDVQALAEHIRQEAPADAQVTAEPAGVRLPFIPF
jgi:FMN phosphatase YigB (HAD superfamily)